MDGKSERYGSPWLTQSEAASYARIGKERIAQLILLPYLPIEFDEVTDLPETARGEGGFGSTGR